MAFIKGNGNGIYSIPRWLTLTLALLTLCSTIWAISASVANANLRNDIDRNRELVISNTERMIVLDVIRQDIAVIKSQVSMLIEGKIRNLPEETKSSLRGRK